MIPRTFGSATGITLMVESARDPKRIDNIVRTASRFLLLVVFPVHLGAAAIAAQALGFAYGTKYIEAIPVVMIAAILSIPRAFQELAEVLLRAADRQKQILTWFSVTGLVNISLDWYLIPHSHHDPAAPVTMARRAAFADRLVSLIPVEGAVGAAWGNGLSQTFGIVAIWIHGAPLSITSGFPWGSAVRLMAAGIFMAFLTNFVVRSLPRPWGLIAAVITAAISYIVLVKLFRALQPWDRKRLALMGDKMPGWLQQVFMFLVDFATPPNRILRA